MRRGDCQNHAAGDLARLVAGWHRRADRRAGDAAAGARPGDALRHAEIRARCRLAVRRRRQAGATDLETDYHATIERFLALEAMGSADPRAELRHLRTLVFARGEPDLRVLQEGIRILETTDRRAALPDLGVPSAWISGRRDRLVPPQAMAWSASQCGGSYDDIQQAGHAPFFGHADSVAQALQPLLTSANAMSLI